MSKEINIYKTQSTIDSTDQDLDLNTDIVHNKTNTYNSLSDLYGIQLFTDVSGRNARRYGRNQQAAASGGLRLSVL